MWKTLSLTWIGICVGSLLFALDRAAANDGRPLRVGILENIATTTGPPLDDKAFAKLDSLVDVQPGTHRVPLVPFSATQQWQVANEIIGATGETISLPDLWSPDGQLFFGVTWDPHRPGHAARQTLLQNWLAQYKDRAADLQRQGFASVPNPIPSDVALFQNSNGRWCAFDWNADLVYSKDEIFRLRQEWTTVTVDGGRTVMIHDPNGNQSLAELSNDPGQIHLDVWIWESQPAAASPPLLASVIDNLEEDDTAIWLDLGFGLREKRGPDWHDVWRAARLAVQSQCDLLVVDCQQSELERESLCRVLARASKKFRLPIIVNQPSLVAPRFVVEPRRLQVPEIAPLVTPTPTPPSGFQEYLLATLEALRDNRPMVESGPAEFSWDDLFHSSLQDGTRSNPARRSIMALPSDMILPLIEKDSERESMASGPSYDASGQRMGNVFAAGDRRVASTVRMLQAAGGYQEIKPDRDPIAFLRGHKAIRSFQTSPQSPLYRIPLTSNRPFSPTLELRSLTGMQPLTRCESDDVPAVVRQAARASIRGSDAAHARWYRLDAWAEAKGPGALVTRPSDSVSSWSAGSFVVQWYGNEGTHLDLPRYLGEPIPPSRRTRWLWVEWPEYGNLAAPDLYFETLESECFQVVWQRVTPWREETSYQSAVYEGPLPNLGNSDPGTPEYGDFDAIWAGLYDQNQLIRWFWLEPETPRENAGRRRWGTELPPWWTFYKEDPAEDWILANGQLGQSPAQVLQRVLSSPEGSGDIMDLRLRLHALDQLAVRKQNLDQTIATADQILGWCRLQVPDLPTGAESEWREPERTAAQWQIHAWAVDAAYRRFRAVGYRELPEVLEREPIADWEQQTLDFETAFAEMAALVPLDHPEFVLSRVRRQRRLGNPWKALEALEVYAAFDENPRWYYKKLRDLYTDLQLELPRRWANARWFEVDQLKP